MLVPDEEFVAALRRLEPPRTEEDSVHALRSLIEQSPRHALHEAWKVFCEEIDTKGEDCTVKDIDRMVRGLTQSGDADLREMALRRIAETHPEVVRTYVRQRFQTNDPWPGELPMLTRVFTDIGKE